MKKNLIMIVSLILLSMLMVTQTFAHGDDSDPEPTAQAITVPNSEANSNNGTEIAISEEVESSAFDSGLITIIGSLVLSIVIASTTWFITQGKLPNIAFGIGMLISYTALIHIGFGLSGDLLLIANGIGYLIWYVLRSIPQIRMSRFFNWLDVIFVGYTFITFVGYFALHDHIEFVGMTSKVTEILLIGFIVYRLLKMNSTSTTPTQLQAI